jgi:hypothetical protein
VVLATTFERPPVFDQQTFVGKQYELQIHDMTAHGMWEQAWHWTSPG